MLFKGVSFRLGRNYIIPAAVLALCTIRAHAQYLLPTVCVEYVPGSTNYLARFGYISQNPDSIFIPINSASNFLAPVRSPMGQPNNFVPGVTTTALTLLLPNTTVETWHLSTLSVTSVSYQYVANANAGTTPTTLTPSPVCPMVIEPATLRYTAPGTYNNVFLGQVDSGPSATGVTAAAFASSPGVAFTNLTYVPADPANPTNTLNPNSIYGTVTITGNSNPSAGFTLQLSTNGIPAASATGSIKVRLSGIAGSDLRNNMEDEAPEVGTIVRR